MPSVLVTKAKIAAANAELLLPGNTEAINVASIYARANGYVRERMVDIGSVVKAGETLAVIEAMKMENVLRAERDGIIKKIRVKQGDSIAVDAVVMEFA